MKIRPLMLTTMFAKNFKMPERFGDGAGGLGLSLRVRPRVPRQLHQVVDAERLYRGQAHQTRPPWLSRLTLAKARKRALENARAIASGRDPRGGSPQRAYLR